MFLYLLWCRELGALHDLPVLETASLRRVDEVRRHALAVDIARAADAAHAVFPYVPFDV